MIHWYTQGKTYFFAFTREVLLHNIWQVTDDPTPKLVGMVRKGKLWGAQSQISPKSDTHLTPKGLKDGHSQMVDNFFKSLFQETTD